MTPSKRPSGRFVLRLPPPLHAALAASAAARGISLNEHCVRSLARAEAAALPGDITDAVARALEQLGADVEAVAIFGSWPRGEAGPSSDVDMLIVVAPGVDITRSLYAPWDHDDRRIDGHRLEPHFVRMRSAGDPVSGLWAEIALDGAVVYDPDLS
ncbi:MAG TPA: toxin-antitoxin system HicB family antitoxin, partial [Longimicrobiales bacterium]|nr:toxin-antitoxin system HicB family antitoxin [Longimicrobiales bacterium]